MRLRLCASALVLLLLLDTASANCDTGCETYCTGKAGLAFDDCLLKCRASCESPLRVEDPYLELVELKSLAQDYPITGFDGDREPPFSYLFFTTLHGRVYKIDTRDNSVRLVHSMPMARLFTANGCGLYDIAVDSEFHTNRLLYLYHAMHDARKEVHHVNALSMYRELDSGELRFERVVRHYVHFQPTLHAWAKQDLRQYVVQGPAPILLTNPGNPFAELSLRHQRPYLSAISAFFVNQSLAAKQVVLSATIGEYIWARGVGDPISCARTRYLAEDVMCLSQLGNWTLLYDTHRTGEYACVGELCEKRVHANLTAGCPVESLIYYTGRGSLKPTRLLSRAACYLNGTFQPAEVLKLSQPRNGRYWATTPVRTQTADGRSLPLTHTKLLTADTFNVIYYGGYSLRDSAYHLYQVKRVKPLY